MEKKYKFHIHGMHCKSCVILIEDSFSKIDEVKEVKVDLENHQLEFVGYFQDLNDQQITKLLTEKIEKYGYKVDLEKQIHSKNYNEFKIAIPIALIFILFFIFLQKLGLVNLIKTTKINYLSSFIIGIVASLSTCMAIVGGLLLSMSATFAKEGNKIKPQLMFHLGRIISFFLLGAVIGKIGTVFSLNTTITFVLNIIVVFIMFILGLNLLEIFPWAKKLQPTIPKFISKKTYSTSNLNNTLTPFIVGISTFFLPCGFTQSMQIYTLTIGSFLKGGLTMLFFTLGTLPVLLLISFSSFSMTDKKSGIFFKTAGIIVIIFSIFNFINSLVIINIIPPIFNF